MARQQIQEYTRQLANGSKVTVHSHRRTYEPAAASPTSQRTSVENIRRTREKEQSRDRRREAVQRGKAAAVKGATATKRRAGQSWRMTQRGGKRLRRAVQLAGRKRKAAATCAAVAGVAEIGAALAWSTTGLIVTTVSILAATVAGGLFIGRKNES